MQKLKASKGVSAAVIMSALLIFSGIQRASADEAADERAAIAMYTAGRYPEAAGLFKSLVRRGNAATACYYLGLCLTQMRQPALATDYFFQAFENNASASPPNPQMAKLCQQALANAAWCKVISLKGDQPQSIKVQSRDGKVLLDGQLAWGSKGLVGKFDSSIDVKWGRFVVPGIVEEQVKGALVGNNFDIKDSHVGGGVNIVINKKDQFKITTTTNLDEEVDFKKLEEQSKKAPRMVVCFTHGLNKSGGTDVYLTVYPGTTLASAR